MSTKNNYVKGWKWFYHQNRERKSFMILCVSIICYISGFLAYQSLPEGPRPQYTKIENYFSIFSTIGILAGIFLSHLACLLFKAGSEK